MNILIGVCGSISCYRIYDLVRSLIKDGHKVKVILTQGAEKFIRAETFRYLGVEDVYSPSDDFNPHKLKPNQNVLHIELAKWPDRFIIAPASINTINTLGNGLTPDLLSTLFISLQDKPILIFPAANPKMLTHPLTQRSMRRLKELNWVWLAPTQSGELVCGDQGEGKLLEVEALKNLCLSYNPLREKNKSVLLTTGAARSPLDPVRYLTNSSSGKTGRGIALYYLQQGYNVHALCGPEAADLFDNLKDHPKLKISKAFTTQDFLTLALKYFPLSDIYISAAALCDIEFEENAQKVKKNSLDDHLKIKKAPDVLAEILKIKQPHQKVIGFAAETSLSDEVLAEKFKRKPVDLLVGNVVNSSSRETQAKGFGTEEGDYWFAHQHGLEKVGRLSKSELSTEIFNRIQ